MKIPATAGMETNTLYGRCIFEWTEFSICDVNSVEQFPLTNLLPYGKI